MENENRPIPGRIYALTGATGTPAISNGNTWAESEVNKNLLPKEKAVLVKVALKKVFSAKQIHVTTGRGTAYGWITADVSLPIPADCRCDDEFGTGMNRQPGYCQACRLTMDIHRNRANAAVELARVPFSTYSADDGYNTETKEFLLNVRVE